MVKTTALYAMVHLTFFPTVHARLAPDADPNAAHTAGRTPLREPPGNEDAARSWWTLAMLAAIDVAMKIEDAW